ncbi:hypothetical protein D3C71_1510580 [compost metagenome]
MRQFQPAGRAPDQLRPESPFQFLQVAADVGPRHALAQGRLAERARFDDGHEQLDQVQV